MYKGMNLRVLTGRVNFEKKNHASNKIGDLVAIKVQKYFTLAFLSLL